MAESKVIKIVIQAVDETSPTIRRLNAEVKKLESSPMKMRVDYDSPEFKKKTETFKKSFQEVKEKVQEVEKVSNEATQSIDNTGESLFDFQSIIGGFAGGLAVAGIGMITNAFYSLANATFEAGKQSLIAGANFEQTVNAMESLTGSVESARKELKTIEETALNTKGLKLASAEEGSQSLRSVSVEAERARKLIKELAEEKIFSGATDEALNSTIGNFKNLVTGGQEIKEVVKDLKTSLPSTKIALMDAFGTLDPTKIQSIIGTDIDKFFDDLTASMEKNKATSGGLNDAYSKFTDTLLIAGRELSAPIIPDLTRDLESLNKSLDNNKSKWSEWGENIKTIYNDVKDVIQQTNARFEQQNGESEVSRLLRLGPNASKYDGKSPNPIGIYLDSRRNERVSSGLSALDKAGEIEAERIAQEERDLQNKERNRVKELASISSYQKLIESITESGYKVAQTQLNSHLRLTLQDEFNHIRQSNQLNLSNIRQQISEQQSFFDRQIALNSNNSVEVQRLIREKNSVLNKLNAEYYISELNTQKAIAEIERRVLESRRQSVIEFKRLQAREVAQVADGGRFDINRTLSLTGNFNEIKANFDKLRNLTNSEYQANKKLISEQFDVQLQNERLTWEEKTNLTKTKFLELENLREKHRQNIQEIDDRARERELSMIDQSFSRQLEKQNQFAQNLETRFQITSLFAQNYALDVEKSIKNIKDDVKLFEGNEFIVNGLNNLGMVIENSKGKPTEKLGLDIITAQNNIQNKLFETRKEGIKKQLDAAAKGTQTEINLQDQLTLVQNEELQSRLNFALSYQEKYFQTLDGMKEKLNAIRSGKADKDLTNQAEKDVTIEISNTYQEIANLKERIASFDEISGLEKQVTYLQQILELRKVENEIAKKGTFNPLEAQLELTGYLNQNVKSLTQSYVDFRTTIASGALEQISSPFDRLRSKLEGLPPLIKGIASAFVNLANDMVRAFSQKLISQILGVGGNSGQSSGGRFSVGNLLQGLMGGNGASSGGFGGSSSSGLSFPSSNNFAVAGAGGSGFSLPSLNLGGANFSGSVSRLFGSSPTGSIGADGGFNVSGSSFGGRNEFAGTIANQATSQLSNYSKFKSLFSGKGNLLGSMAPMLGMSLGGLAGGQSTAGQILGSIGGLGAGLLGGIATGAINASTMLGGIFASGGAAGAGGALSIGGLSAAMSATVVLAPIAGALLIGSLLLKRNAARRRDETTRDKLMVDSLAELNKIKAEMEAARPGTNIQGLLDQTGEISGEYFKQANALKDKKTRGIAIKDGNERVGVVPPNSAFPNALTNQIYALSQGAKMKEEMRMAAADRDRLAIPEFAMGGLIPAKRGGHLAVVGEGGYDEFILSTDPRYANRTAKLLGGFIEKMNYRMPKFEMGGISSGANLSQSNTPISFGQNNAPIYINISIPTEVDAEGIVVKGIKTSSDAQREIIVTVEKAAKDDKLKLERRK